MWNIEYYQTRAGRLPVAEFIESLDAKSRAKLARTLDLLEEFGTDLGMPYAKYLEKQLWELRVQHGRSRYRIVYFLTSGGSFVLLHAFTKKTEAVPRNHLDTAEARRDDYLSRGR